MKNLEILNNWTISTGQLDPMGKGIMATINGDNNDILGMLYPSEKEGFYTVFKSAVLRKNVDISLEDLKKRKIDYDDGASNIQYSFIYKNVRYFTLCDDKREADMEMFLDFELR